VLEGWFGWSGWGRRRKKRMLDVGLYQEHIELHLEKRQLENQLEKVKQKIADGEHRLIEELVANEMQKISIGGETCYINSTIWANVSDKNKAIEVLLNEGYGDLVKPSYNSNQISRLLRDFDENGQDAPASFAGIIEPFVKYSLKVIKS